MFSFEQGPFRPPSEAYSLLIRVTRNCPWNKCEFCLLYKGEKFEQRAVEEIKEDIENVRNAVEWIKELSWKSGSGGNITRDVLNLVYEKNPEILNIALWMHSGGKTVFIQDADSLRLKHENMVEVLKYISEVFPHVERITSYARSKTLAIHKSVKELAELYEAGLTRLHVGLETGYDPLLKLMRKGVTAQEQVEAGQKVRETDIELSEYVILGLGGRDMWREHAQATAVVLNKINPHFIRVRTLAIREGMPLYEKWDSGYFIMSDEDGVVREERLLIRELKGITSYFASDHILNLLEINGQLPEDKPQMLADIDYYLSLSEQERINYQIGRRAGIYYRLEDIKNKHLNQQVNRILGQFKGENRNIQKTLVELRARFI